MSDQTPPLAAQAVVAIRQAELLLAQLPHRGGGPDLTGAELAVDAALADLAEAGPLPTQLPHPAPSVAGGRAEARRLLDAAAATLRSIRTTSPDQTLAVGAAIDHLHHAAQLLSNRTPAPG